MQKSPVQPRAYAAWSENYRVDAAGYLPLAQKVAVLRQPVQGFDAPSGFSAPPTMSVLNRATWQVVFTGPVAAWGSGQVHSQSGDRVWWFDFSPVQAPGEYCLLNPETGEKVQPFRIGPDVYHGIAREAVRALYFQRCGVAKDSAHAGNLHVDGSPCHVGVGQDAACRAILNPTVASALDLSGGWHDAGDYNKYINFAGPTVCALLFAYEQGGYALGDTLGIPESGNGVPDLLDEIRVELEWMLKMQTTGGALLHKVSVTAHQSASPPSADSAPRFYAPATASATATGAMTFALGARVFRDQGSPSALAFADALEDAAIDAWSWLAANPGQIPSSYDNAGFASAGAEFSSYEQEMVRLHAAAGLFHLTGDATYRTWFDSHYQNAHLFPWFWASPFETTAQEALLAYCAAPGATVAVRTAILNQYAVVLSAPGLLGSWVGGADAYRSKMEDQDIGWGSNRDKSAFGDIFQVMVRWNLDASNQQHYADAALGYLHYVHGVNPLGLCYLTNLDGIGIKNSPREMYHAWFGHGTPWDNADTGPGPAPGFVTGGVNPNFAPDPAYNGPPLSPPMGQPILKSYRDWNTSWPENSWEVTEPAIAYQAQYIRLVCSFL